jgi:signal peptidase I
MFFSKSLSSSKLRHILQEQAQLYRDHPDERPPRMKEELLKLESLINQNKREEATRLAHDLEAFSKEYFKKNWVKGFFKGALGLALALIAAVVIRQMWFELYEIPTGSMRPTFREQDLVSVSKTPYGINIPLVTDHFLFEPDHVQRGSIVIFSGDKLDLSDTDTTFLYLFPYKKRYVKRMIGKPGDTLYFYGGRVYGIDKEGKPIEDLLGKGWMEKLEYIPFINFEGKVLSGSSGRITLKQVNEEVGRLTESPIEGFKGEVLTPSGWVKDDPAKSKSSTTPATLSDLWGMGNFAKARILNKNGSYVLELNHHPSLTTPAPYFAKEGHGYNFLLTPQKSTLPLDEELLKRLWDNLYTARFVVKGGKGIRYQAGGEKANRFSPDFPGVPDGTYEFYFGKAYEVGRGGWLSELPPEHPLNQYSAEKLTRLYNLGIEMDTRFKGEPTNLLLPTRFAYFRDGDLMVLGAPLLKASDPRLTRFVQEEKKRGEISTYLPFIDLPAAPDAQKIAAYGIKIPDRHYLVLGDNHAMSGDSRFFGFVPEENLQGAPSLIFWPPSERAGFPNMIPYPLFPISRLIVWTLALIGFAIWAYWRHKKLNQPLDL